jgi:hypothetical protein
MAAKSRRKGMRNEQGLSNLLKAAGLDAERVPLSGAAHGSFGGDLVVNGRKIEVKVRADGSGFKSLYDWIEGNYALAVRSDRREWLITIRLEDWIELMTKGGTAAAPPIRGLDGGKDGDDELRDRGGLWLP